LETLEIAKDIEKILYILILKQNDDIIYSKLILNRQNSDYKFSFETSDFSTFIAKTLFTNDLHIGVVKINVSKMEIFDLYINKNDLYLQSLENLIHTKYQNLNSNLNIFTEEPNKTRLFEIFTPKMQNMIANQIEIFDSLTISYFNNDFNSENEFYEKVIIAIGDSYKLLQNQIIVVNREREILFYQQTYLFVKGYLEGLFRLWSIFTGILYNEKKFSTKQLEGMAIEVINILTLISYDNPFLMCLFFNPPLVNKFFYKEKDKPRKPIFQCYYEFYHTLSKVIKNYNYKLDYSYFISQLLSVENLDNVI
jgi:hypothetical protein